MKILKAFSTSSYRLNQFVSEQWRSNDRFGSANKQHDCPLHYFFFQLADVTTGLRGHSMKLFKPRCRTTVRQHFFSLRIVNEWNKLPQTVIEAFKNRLDRRRPIQLTGYTAHQQQVQVSHHCCLEH